MDFNFNLTKEQQLILLGLVFSVVVGLGVMGYRHFISVRDKEIEIEDMGVSKKLVTNTSLMVHVSGAIRREGVYKLNPGDRILDAVKIAGGVLPSADLSTVNLAEPVKDGQKIIIPARQLASEIVDGIRKGNKSGQKININVADEKTLESLPGIGPTMAKAIVEYRKINGPFTKIEQIMEIPRFGKKKFEKIKDKIMI